MKQFKVLTILGTRPEAIKLAPVLRELGVHRERFDSRVCVTAQHREMLDQALKPFDIVPDYDLNIMVSGQRLADLTARAVTQLDGVIQSTEPDVVLVQGDTTTAFCGALAAFYSRRRIGHIEAGLRTGNRYAPYPEEVNRCLISQICDYHFAPTEHSGSALVKSGVDARSVHVTGNTVVDSLLWMRDRVAEHEPPLPPELARNLDGRDVIMVTGHRRESFGDGLANICQAIRDVAEAFPNVVFVYPVHLNPNVREPVRAILDHHAGVRLLEPLAYDAFVWLMNRAMIVLTDSGGVQEEAPVLGKPVLVTRETTERPEGIAAGNARLVGVRRGDIVAGISELLRSPSVCERMGRARSPYGDGRAAQRIVQILLKSLDTESQLIS